MQEKDKEVAQPEEKEKIEVSELDDQDLDDVSGGADTNYGCNFGCTKAN